MTSSSDVTSALDGRPALLQDASRRALRYLAALADRPVAPSAAAVLALLDEIGSPATMASAGPRYFGFVTGGTLPVRAGGWLAGQRLGPEHGSVRHVALVGRTCQLACRFADGMRDAGFSVLNDVVLNQVVVDFGNAARTESVIAAIQREGTCWCGPTVWHGRTAMRVSVSGWNTTNDDIDTSIAAVRAASH